MSSPRYDWWGYVKGMIRRYPELCRKEAALKSISISPSLSGMPHSGKLSDQTAEVAMRQLPDINQRELEAVSNAIVQTMQRDDGVERLQMVRLVFWAMTHTLEGAAIECHVSYATAKNWHNDFIRRVAKNFHLL